MYFTVLFSQIQDIIIERKNIIKEKIEMKTAAFCLISKINLYNFNLYSTLVAGFNIQLSYYSLNNLLTFGIFSNSGKLQNNEKI